MQFDDGSVDSGSAVDYLRDYAQKHGMNAKKNVVSLSGIEYPERANAQLVFLFVNTLFTSGVLIFIFLRYLIGTPENSFILVWCAVSLSMSVAYILWLRNWRPVWAARLFPCACGVVYVRARRVLGNRRRKENQAWLEALEVDTCGSCAAGDGV